jgi:hypothetical protein
LEKKQNQRPSATDLLTHEFITTAGPMSVLQKSLCEKVAEVKDLKPSVPTLKKPTSQQDNIPTWDFDSIDSNPKLAKKYNDTLKIGKCVAFEDEFDVSLPEEQYNETIPFGYDLLKSIVIPAFTQQRKECSKEHVVILDQLIESMGQLAVKEPIVAEKACRKMLEDLFSSSRQSLKEFLSTISKQHEEEVDFEIDEQDAQKLSFHSTEAVQAPIVHYRSQIGEYLLKRWLKR